MQKWAIPLQLQTHPWWWPLVADSFCSREASCAILLDFNKLHWRFSTDVLVHGSLYLGRYCQSISWCKHIRGTKSIRHCRAWRCRTNALWDVAPLTFYDCFLAFADLRTLYGPQCRASLASTYRTLMCSPHVKRLGATLEKLPPEVDPPLW